MLPKNIMDDLYQKLKRPFDVRKISWRVGSTNQDKTKGIALAYIDARDVMYRLDEVFGLNWQCRYSHAEGKTICEIGVNLEGEWIWRAGGAGDTDIEAEKGAISDAFKRAAVLWGIGRYLYELPNEWVPIATAGRSYKLASTPSLPSWATPEGYDNAIKGKGVHKPTDNQDFKPEPDEETFLLSIVDKLITYDPDYVSAWEYMENEHLDADERAWIWNKMGAYTKLRAGIKKVGEERKKA